MEVNLHSISQALLAIGSISGLISLPFTLKSELKKGSKFKFDFRGSTGAFFTRDNLEFYELVFDGHIKNQSTEPNSITEIYYSIWGNKARTKTLAYGSGAQIYDADNRENKTSLPILFEGKAARHLVIKFEICLTGTHVNELVLASPPNFGHRFSI